MVFDTMSIFAYTTGLILVFVICRIFIRPFARLFKIIFNSICGGLALAAFNYLGAFAGISVIINPLSSLIAGFLGIPGVILVIILQYIL